MVQKMVEQPKKHYGWIVALFVVFFMVILFFGFIGLFISVVFFDDGPTLTGNVAVIPLVGPIVGDGEEDFFSGADVAISSRIVEKIHKAEDDHSIRAIILEINSPGGSPVASDEIAQAVEKSKKPILVVIREIGASGAYWAAAPADVIIAHHMSMVGSIGVISSYLEFPDLLNRFNITYNRLVAGKYKDTGTPYRKLDEEGEKLIQEMLDEIYYEFINQVATHRKLDPKFVEQLATGWVYTGRKAKELGLIDELGGREEALAIIEKDLNIRAEVVEYKTQPTFFDYLSGSTQASAKQVGMGIGESLITASTKPQSFEVKV